MNIELNQLKIQNGFPNHDGLGNHLICILISGRLELNDFLILPNGLNIPIIEIREIPINLPEKQYQITIPRKHDSSFKWFQLYGTIIDFGKQK